MTEGNCEAGIGKEPAAAGAAGGVGGRPGDGEASGVADGREIGSPIEMSSGVKAGASSAAFARVPPQTVTAIPTNAASQPALIATQANGREHRHESRRKSCGRLIKPNALPARL